MDLQTKKLYRDMRARANRLCEKENEKRLNAETETMARDRVSVAVLTLLADDSLELEEKVKRFREILQQGAKAAETLAAQDATFNNLDGRRVGDPATESYIKSITGAGSRDPKVRRFVEAITY